MACATVDTTVSNEARLAVNVYWPGLIVRYRSPAARLPYTVPVADSIPAAKHFAFSESTVGIGVQVVALTAVIFTSFAKKFTPTELGAKLANLILEPGRGSVSAMLWTAVSSKILHEVSNA